MHKTIIIIFVKTTSLSKPHVECSRPVSDSGVPRIVHHPSDVVVRVGSPATLSCRAEGNPEPTIQWLRNGQPLDTDKMDAQSQPIVLPEGSLFFFSVVPGRKSQSHEAVYACVARNSAGVATSRNASLHIAGLNHDKVWLIYSAFHWIGAGPD
uniref:Ig-like domain-containing protein n=1 Tax=Sinocyclocheilus rhinocerous TaxID=307959 RepID=A0A673MFP5_9TELE